MIPSFLDANIPILATGPAIAPKDECLRLLGLARAYPGSCVTSAEVLQEVFHVLHRRVLPERLQQTLALVTGAVHGNVVPMLAFVVLRAASLDLRHLQARDLVHLATMERLGISAIISTDTGFDGVPGVRRLDPLLLATWRDEVFATP